MTHPTPRGPDIGLALEQRVGHPGHRGQLKVISIIGSGRSGSTVLDVVLGSHPAIEGVGALAKLPSSGWIRNDDRRCACGRPIHGCGYWLEVYRRWSEEVGEGGLARYIRLQSRYERSRAWARLLLEERRASPAFRTYGWMTATLYQAISKVSGRSIIVDSSKRPVRTYALLATGALDIRVTHLIRDGRGVVWSRSRPLERNVEAGVPRSRPPTPWWRSTCHWMLANLESKWVSRRAGAGKATRITYEAIVQRPAEVLKDLSLVIGEDLGPIALAIAQGRVMASGHRVGGNRSRLSGSIRLRPDFRWTTELPAGEAAKFWRAAGWLAERYGYAR